ncbi:MAG: serine hydrolase domain-containing protein [Ilumatobacteraceae bacterium]
MDLTRTVAPYVASGTIPGLAALIGHGADEVDAVVLGTAAIDDPRPLTRDAIFRIASLTKPMVAVAAMVLVDAGVVRLEDPVEELLPELADRRVLRTIDGPLDDTVPAQRAITLEDLLSLRFGFGFSPRFPFPGTTPIQEAEATLELGTLGPPWPPASIDNTEWMRRLGTLPLLAQPGSTWTYNTGIHVAAVLLERATGATLDAVLRDRLFAPLGMVDTGFSVPPADVPRLVSFYGADPSTGDLQLIDRGDASSWWASPPAKLDGSGGLVSTLDDVWSFARMMACGGRHEGERLLSAASFDLLTTDRLTAAQRAASTLFLGEDSGWGLGMATPLDGIGSFGWDGGTGTSWRTEPSSGTTAIVLTQRAMGGPQPPEIFRDVWSVAFGR